MRVLANYAQGHDNNLNLLRFVAASAVLGAHCWPLSGGTDKDDPLYGLIGMTTGGLAVLVFFAISGFLVAASWNRTPRASAFIAARALRIFPALIVVLMATAFVLGPAMTVLPWRQYFASATTWAYVPVGLALLRAPVETLPGVFASVHYPFTLNGSLWTLFFEVNLYVLVLLLGILGWLRPKRFGLVLLGLVIASIFVSLLPIAKTSATLAKFALLGPPFLAGNAAWIWREKIPMHGILIATCVAAATIALHFGVTAATPLFSIAIAWLALYLALVPAGSIRSFNRLGDYSYGIYIYAFPVQQTVVSLVPSLGNGGLFAVSFPITLCLSVLSWNVIESPALRLRKHLTTKRFLQPRFLQSSDGAVRHVPRA